MNTTHEYRNQHTILVVLYLLASFVQLISSGFVEPDSGASQLQTTGGAGSGPEGRG